MRGLIKSEVLDIGAADIVTAVYFCALFTAAAAFTHPSIGRALDKRVTACLGQRDARLTVLGCCLLLPIALVAAVPDQSMLDRVMRTTLTVLLIAFGLVAVAERDPCQQSGGARTVHEESGRRAHRPSEPCPADLRHRRGARRHVADRVAPVADAGQPRPLQEHQRQPRTRRSPTRCCASSVPASAGWPRDIGAHIARPSGDEFVILDRDAGSPAHAFARAESVHAALSEPFIVDGVSVFVTSSIGLAVVPKNRTITPEEFLRRADIATHRAKANGRNCIALFDESMQTSVTQRMDMENALYGAVERRELRLYHQPIVEIETGRISGFEALIRWRRDDGTLIAPADFIFIAEDTGLINTIGAWALLEALTELRRWINEGIVEDTTTISVNVSPRQIADPHFADIVQEALDPLRRATSPAVARGHRVDDAVGARDRQEHVAAGAGDGRAAGARRLRHRLLVAVAAPAVPAPADQDRPGLHPRRRRPRQRPFARAHDRRDGLVDGSRRRRRGRREHPPAPGRCATSAATRRRDISSATRSPPTRCARRWSPCRISVRSGSSEPQRGRRTRS